MFLNLLVQTQGDEVKYKNYVADLKTQQIEANKRLFAQVQLERGNGNNGGYTYNDWPYSMRPGPCMEGDGPDRWGYCTRQCVSYAAWAVERSGRNAPIGFGDARMWVDHGIPQYNIPKKGDVGINTGGHYGHAMYVEDVYSDGSIRISQYNADGATGRYSEATLQSWQSSAYVFLRFP